VRERVRYLYGSLQTEKVYVYWANAFVLWAAQMGGCFRRPRELGRAEVEDFLIMRDTEQRWENPTPGQPAGHTADAPALLAVGCHLPALTRQEP
jgi:hypothetical protein